MATEFDPSQEGELRQLHGPRWVLEQDFAQPTLDIIESGRHLRRFEAEVDANYQYRLSNACPLDMIPDALAIREDNIFRVPPVRTFDDSPYKDIIETLISDADNEGTPLNTFMRKALFFRNSMGADIVTQMTAAPDDVEITSQADVIEANLRPFFLLFSPLQKVDWSCTGSGKYLWVRYALGMQPVATEMSGSSDILQFLSLTPEGWTRWDQKIDNVEGTSQKADSSETEVVKVGEGMHPLALGIVPAVKLYHGESMKAGEGCVPISLISRAAVIARCLQNLKSQADMDLLASVTRWMLKGLDAENAPTEFGPLSLWVTNNTDADMIAKNGGTEQIQEKRIWVALYIDEILRLLKFRGGMGEVSGNQGSGVKLALEMTDLRNELLATASQMEAAELEMMRQAVVMQTGDEIPAGKEAAEVLGYRVQYNKEFVLDTAAELAELMKMWFVDLIDVSGNMPEVSSAILQRFQGEWIRDDDPASEQSTEEIEAAVNTIIPPEPDRHLQEHEPKAGERRTPEEIAAEEAEAA